MTRVLSEANLREQDRLASLGPYDVLDQPAEKALERLLRLTRFLLDVPAAAIALKDEHRRWSAWAGNKDLWDTAEDSLLVRATAREDGLLVVADASLDPRFASDPLVGRLPGIRFFAGRALRTRDGDVVGVVCAMDTQPRSCSPEQILAMNDVAELMMTELALRRLATIDELTGTLSRRAFQERAELLIAAARGGDRQLGCILFDVDRTSAINDELGPVIGDRVLAEICSACRPEVGADDLFGRLGGEEFAILLPGASLQRTRQTAETLREHIARCRIVGPHGPVGVTASFGATSLGHEDVCLDSLLQRADAALSIAKAEGRNRCVEWRADASDRPVLRHRVFKAGRISFHHGHATIDCTVRSLSDTGAGLDVFSSAGIPDGFKLEIEADGLYRACRVAARRDKHIEVEFD